MTHLMACENTTLPHTLYAGGKDLTDYASENWYKYLIQICINIIGYHSKANYVDLRK